MKILGIAALYHDAAAALTVDGVIVAAAQEERFTRIKHDKQIPVNAIQYCLREGRCLFSDIDIIVYYDNPLLTVQRFCKNICTLQERADDLLDRSFDDMFGDKVWVKHNLLSEFGKMKRGGVLPCE